MRSKGLGMPPWSTSRKSGDLQLVGKAFITIKTHKDNPYIVEAMVVGVMSLTTCNCVNGDIG